MIRNNEKTKEERRTLRTRSKIFGTKDRPRVCVYRSNKYIYAQMIDDASGVTLGSVDSEVKALSKGVTKTEAAFKLGKKFAERAKSLGVDTVVFDKGPYKYHGRVKSFAEGAREGGLIF